jgi:ligand-binding sensor domain-containing protein/serine phosphatase RsbU (regulator of sigma subunit)
MWFGTQDGLNRYDGYSIKVFKNNPSKPNSLSENFIYAIYGDEKGQLYIETQSGTFQKYDPRTESFIVISKDSFDLTTLRSSNFNAVLEEKNYRWIGGQAHEIGLLVINKKSGDTTHFRHSPTDPSSLSSDRVYSIFRDRSSNLWVGTFNGLDKFDERSGNFIHYRNDANDPTTISDNYVWTIYEDSRGFFWVGTYRGGLNLFDPNKETFLHYANDESDPTSLSDNCVYSIYEDRGGVIWVGTLDGGVNYFHPSSSVFEHYTSIQGVKNSLSDNSILSMCVDNNGYYWIGTSAGGLDRFEYKTGKFKNFSNIPSNSNSLVSNSIQSLYASKSGILWIGTFSNGLDEFDPKTGTFKHYQNNPSNINSLSDNRIYSIVEDKNGIIWVGTYAGGLNKLDPETGNITRVISIDGDSKTLSSDRVWSMSFDNKGKLWLGTFGGGVNVFDPKTFTVTKVFVNNPDDSTSLADNNIIRVFKDSKGNMWIGSTKGLSKYNQETTSFINYREKDGLANDVVFGILEDNRGNLWISTNNGLSEFNPVTEFFINYFYQDGLQGNEFNQNAFAKDKTFGRLLFGGPNGFNVFDPNNIKENSYVPPVAFTNYIRYNTDDEEGKPILESGISVRDSILLTYKDNIITLQFAAMSYYNNYENQYKYKLEGFNENWIQLGNNHTVTFTNLSPDDYVLRVIGSNNDGVWNEKGASLFVKVLPPWWRTNVAYTIYAIIFIGVLLGIRRFETKQREQKTQMRENELRLKATEAEKRAIEIENERKTKELEEARELQLSMLPRELPKLPNLEIAAFMRTATEVGGDYYDFIVQDNGILNVAFGDATGHGLQAGTMVTLMKGFFTSDAAKLSLQEFMGHCTAMIKEIKLGRILMSFSLLKFDNNKLLITSAGMPPIYYFNNASQEVEEITIQGMPLGAMRKFSYSVVERKIKSGDTLLLLSDGLPEQMNASEEMFGYSRVSEKFKGIINESPENIIQNLVKSGEDWMGEANQEDDISFVVIRVK